MCSRSSVDRTTHGHRRARRSRGRTLGFPTANLAGVEELLPPYGVYAVLVDRLDSARSTGPADQARLPRALARGVANIGVRPTVGGGPSIEAHLLDFHPTQESELDLTGLACVFTWSSSCAANENSVVSRRSRPKLRRRERRTRRALLAEGGPGPLRRMVLR